MKALVMFGLAYIAVPLSTVFGVQLPAQPKEQQEAVQEEPPLLVAEPVVAPEPPKEKTVDELIEQYFGNAAPAAKKIAQCESGKQPDKIGDVKLQFWKGGVRYGASYGVFQIRYLPGRPAPDELLNAEFNIRYAADLYHAQGWTPWTCRKVLH